MGTDARSSQCARSLLNRSVKQEATPGSGIAAGQRDTKTGSKIRGRSRGEQGEEKKGSVTFSAANRDYPNSDGERKTPREFHTHLNIYTSTHLHKQRTRAQGVPDDGQSVAGVVSQQMQQQRLEV